MRHPKTILTLSILTTMLAAASLIVALIVDRNFVQTSTLQSAAYQNCRTLRSVILIAGDRTHRAATLAFLRRTGLDNCHHRAVTVAHP